VYGREPCAIITSVVGYVDVRAYSELNDFLPSEWRAVAVRRPFRPHQTVKDVLEAMGIPHTEIDLIVVNGESVDFSHRPAAGDRIAAYPLFEALDIGPVVRLRAAPMRNPRFVVDVNLGRLAQLLRLLGFDALWSDDLDDATLSAIGEKQRRIVLTRDRGLLKRRVIAHGLFVRADDPVEQAVEIVRRLDLGGRLEPFTRCLRCNGLLRSVAKADVLDRLEPKTRRYYDDFRTCRACGRIYWRGSHYPRLESLVEEIRAAV